MLSVRLPVYSRQWIVKFEGSQKLNADFGLRGGVSAPLILCVVQGSAEYDIAMTLVLILFI